MKISYFTNTATIFLLTFNISRPGKMSVLNQMDPNEVNFEKTPVLAMI